MLNEGTEKAMLTFGDLKVGEHFIGFPTPGDNHGHGGYLGGYNLFEKMEQRASGQLVSVNSGSAINSRGAMSYFPDDMPVIKVLAGTSLVEQARAIRNVQRAVERNENREINMGEAWALVKEAVAEPKLTK